MLLCDRRIQYKINLTHYQKLKKIKYDSMRKNINGANLTVPDVHFDISVIGNARGQNI